MSVKISDICGLMEEWAPLALAEDFDNVGLLVGNDTYEVERVLIALDAVNEVIEEAVSKKCRLIITHHPVAYTWPKKINASNYSGKRIIALIENKTALYAAHTNLDKADGGVNDIICNMLGIKEVTVKKDKNGQNGLVRCGRLEKPTALCEIAAYAAKIFNSPYTRIVGDEKKMIETVAVVGGSGMSCLDEVLNTGVDLFISGDIKYHDACRAADCGLALIDLTHYASEQAILKYVKEYLDKKKEERGLSFEVILSEINGQPFKSGLPDLKPENADRW